MLVHVQSCCSLDLLFFNYFLVAVAVAVAVAVVIAQPPFKTGLDMITTILGQRS